MEKYNVSFKGSCVVEAENENKAKRHFERWYTMFDRCSGMDVHPCTVDVDEVTGPATLTEGQREEAERFKQACAESAAIYKEQHLEEEFECMMESNFPAWYHIWKGTYMYDFLCLCENKAWWFSSNAAYNFDSRMRILRYIGPYRTI